MATQVEQQLLKALGEIDRPGTYCTSGLMPSMLPGLEVAGVGSVALPLGARQAATLKKQAHQAPYGKGTKTVVDTDVRRVWEIDADKITLSNTEWPAALAQVLRQVQSELGLERQKLEAHLYKLLLYEKGSFFLAHRDGEKLDRMVATLVITLPSAHEGGELILRHEGREEVVDFGPESRFQTQYAAFYADCEHEIKPVKSGYRLTLVYNLTLAKSKRKITAPTSREAIDAVAHVLEQWRKPGKAGRRAAKTDLEEEAETPTKLAVVLDHKYTQTGLSFDALKGIDRARARVLFEAASQKGYDASLALVTYWESGQGESEDDGYGYGYGGRYRYGWDDEDEDEDESENDNENAHGGEYTMVEVFESSLTAEQFSDASGRPLLYGKMPLESTEIVSEMSLDEGTPDKEDFEGYTGNAGMTLDRWYHYAAVLLWPAESRFDVLCEAGVESAIGGLELLVQQWAKAKDDDKAALKSSCLDFADRIIARWPARKYARSFYHENGSETGDMLPLLEKLDDAKRASAWVRKVLGQDVSLDPGNSLGDLLQHFGWLTFRDELKSLFEKTGNETIVRQARFLADWALRKDKSNDRRTLCAEMAPVLMAAVERWNPKKSGSNWEASRVDCSELLPLLLKAFVAVKDEDVLDRMVTYVLDHPKEFSLTTTQVPVIMDLKKWLKQHVKQASPPLARWFSSLVEELEKRAAHPPKAKSDWRRTAGTRCKCEDCQELSRFLKDPKTETLRLPLAQERRRHLHQVIDNNKLDTTHVTERRGRPYTLVLTKTHASYDEASKAHQVDLDQLDKMREVQAWAARLT